MSTRRFTVASATVVIALSMAASLAQPAPRSVKNGVFSAAQAQRGEEIILTECARCHSPSLLGGENNTPPLVGEFFQKKWGGMPLGELFEKMVKTMPTDSPGRLSKAEYADALAYILSANKYPAGALDLTADAAALAEIKIER